MRYHNDGGYQKRLYCADKSSSALTFFPFTSETTIIHGAGHRSLAIEIERKYLVVGSSWRQSLKHACHIRQGYLTTGDAVSVRVRITDETTATLTVKSPKSGLSRFEFEQEISLREGLTLMKMCNGNAIEKVRYDVEWAGCVWEIDDYRGRNHGLVVAEIELCDEAQSFRRPAWLGEEVTGVPQYQNTHLALRPFQTWPEHVQTLEAVRT